MQFSLCQPSGAPVRVITSKQRLSSAYCRFETRSDAQDIALTSQATVTAPSASNDSVDPLITRFLDAVWMERGLSSNTLAAYRADLVALSRWLTARTITLPRTGRVELMDFIAARVHAGARPRSTARQLSSFRRFFRYYMREGVVREDPTAQIAMPKIGRSLPKSVTEEEVEALLAAPTVSDPLGNRDRTMLEVLYATGLRVTELVNLKLGEVNLNQGVVRVLGKGNRERLIPLGEEAVRWLKAFIEGARADILLDRSTEFLFPTRRGNRMTRQAFWHIIKRYRADAARAQRSVHDADLHPRGSRAPERAAHSTSSARLRARPAALDVLF